MHPFPHHYSITTTAVPAGAIVLSSEGIPDLSTATPPEFDGPGGQWSPETMLVGAVADCFALTFRGIARASRFPWITLKCDVVGTLERPEGVTRFTEFRIHAQLTIPEDASVEQARRILTRAEETCLITRSLNAPAHLVIHVDYVGNVEPVGTLATA
jgi:organic hydroperoxide reductase OsmC/OhrA